MHPVPGGGGYLAETPQEFPPLEDHLCAKFCPDPLQGFEFLREHTQTDFMYSITLKYYIHKYYYVWHLLFEP